MPTLDAVVTENSVRSEIKGVPISREIMVATTMSPLFVAFFALIASTFRTRAGLQAEILALRHCVWHAGLYASTAGRIEATNILFTILRRRW